MPTLFDICGALIFALSIICFAGPPTVSGLGFWLLLLAGAMFAARVKFFGNNDTRHE